MPEPVEKLPQGVGSRHARGLPLRVAAIPLRALASPSRPSLFGISEGDGERGKQAKPMPKRVVHRAHNIPHGRFAAQIVGLLLGRFEASQEVLR